VMLAACDIYRPAAITQLQTLGKQLNVPVYSEGPGAKPPEIAANALEQAKKDLVNVLIIDTAGRLQIDEPLMEELEQIDQRVHATERLLVVDAMTGQEAVRVADTFNQRVSVSGLVMTKMDGDARGGAALSVRAVTGVPIKFISSGEKVDTNTLEPFYPDRLASRILGMGDVLSLIEKAEQIYDAEQAKAMEKKLRKGKFDFEDFLSSMQQMRKLGPLQELLKLIPGMGQLAKQEELLDESQLKRVEAIIFSMTPLERRNPEIIKPSRRARIAKGSGTSEQDVSALIKQFMQMQRMMKQMAGGQGGGKGRGRGGRGGRGGGPGGIDPRDLMRMLK
jgi:signal recognition particle subunit SRP54